MEQAGWAAGNLAIGSHRAQAALVEAGAVQPLISAVNATLASLDLLAQPPTPEAAAAAPVSHVHHGPEAWHRRDRKTATTGVGVEQVDLGLSPAGAAFGGAKGRTDVPRIVDWYMDGKVNIDDLITHTMPLDEINSAFDLMHEGKSIRSVVTF